MPGGFLSTLPLESRAFLTAHFNGHLIELARNRNIDSNRHCYDLVKRMEKERATPAPHWLDELIRAHSKAEAL